MSDDDRRKRQVSWASSPGTARVTKVITKARRDCAQYRFFVELWLGVRCSSKNWCTSLAAKTPSGRTAHERHRLCTNCVRVADAIARGCQDLLRCETMPTA